MQKKSTCFADPRPRAMRWSASTGRLPQTKHGLFLTKSTYSLQISFCIPHRFLDVAGFADDGVLPGVRLRHSELLAATDTRKDLHNQCLLRLRPLLQLVSESLLPAQRNISARRHYLHLAVQT